MIKYSYATIVYISIHDHETMRSKKSQRTSSAFDAFLSYVTISYAFVWQQERILSSQNKGSNWNGDKSECCCARCQNFSFSRNCFFLHRTYIVVFCIGVLECRRMKFNKLQYKIIHYTSSEIKTHTPHYTQTDTHSPIYSSHTSTHTRIGDGSAADK